MIISSPYCCPCPGASCKWQGSLSEVMGHLMKVHKSITTLQGQFIFVCFMEDEKILISLFFTYSVFLISLFCYELPIVLYVNLPYSWLLLREEQFLYFFYDKTFLLSNQLLKVKAHQFSYIAFKVIVKGNIGMNLTAGEDIVFLATDINLPGAVDWVMMQSCFGYHFMLVLEKQEKFQDGNQMFYAVVQLIGAKKESENFMYR